MLYSIETKMILKKT